MADSNGMERGLFNTTVMQDGGGDDVKAGGDDEACALFRFILYTPAMGVLCVAGVAGNTISLLVLRKDRSAPPAASFMLRCLAVADNALLLLWMLTYSVRDLLHTANLASVYSHPAWLYVRVATFSAMYMAQMETIWLTVALALNRFFVICLPCNSPRLCTPRLVYSQIAIITAVSVLYNVPKFFEIDVRVDANGTTKWTQTSLANNALYRTVYQNVMYYVFTFVLPLVILIVVNTRVIVAYRKTLQRQTSQRTPQSGDSRRSTLSGSLVMTSHGGRKASEKNITLVMIMIVLIFMLCQAPARLVQLIWEYQYADCEQVHYYLIHVSNTLEALNSSVNFIIYVTCYARFRAILCEFFCCGPVAAAHRRNRSQKQISTEGLCLEEVRATTWHSRSALHQRHNGNGASTGGGGGAGGGGVGAGDSYSWTLLEPRLPSGSNSSRRCLPSASSADDVPESSPRHQSGQSQRLLEAPSSCQYDNFGGVYVGEVSPVGAPPTSTITTYVSTTPSPSPDHQLLVDTQ